MSYVKHIELPEARTSSYSGKVRNHAAAFKVTCNALDYPTTAVAGVGISKGSACPWDGYARCTAINTSVESTYTVGDNQKALIYRVDISYSTDAPEYENPLDEPPVISWGTNAQSIGVTNDEAGNPIVNTVGDPIEGVEDDDYTLTLSYTRNEAASPFPGAEEYLGKVNSGTFLGFSAKQVKCTSITAGSAQATVVEDVEVTYYSVTYTFEIKPTGDWKRRLLNVGYRYREDGSGDPKDIYVDGVPVTSPQLLKENGDLWSSGDDPHYVEPYLNETTSFSSLGIVL